MRSRNPLQKKRLSFVIANLVAAGAFAPAHAATIFVAPGVVDSVADGQCSLTEAVQAANTDTATLDCVAGSGADELELGADSVYTFEAPTAGENALEITSEITINGNNATVERSAVGGTPNFRLISSTGVLTLNDLTVRNGQADNDGCILSQNNLTIRRSTVTGCRADAFGGAIAHVSGSLTLVQSTVSDSSANYGGGINLQGVGGAYDITITDSTISGNSARFGGGIRAIFNDAAITMVNSTVSGNTADNFGGGFLDEQAGTVTITNSTLFNNDSPDGGALFTRSDNGILNLRNSVLGGTTSGADCNSTDGNIYQNSGNLIQDGSCSPTISGDPGLGILQDNGGFTFTHALSETSLARDRAGIDNCPATDQRGELRFDGRCDVGAFEGQFDPGPILVDFGVVAVASDGLCSIVEAVNNANNNTVSFPGASECEAGFGDADDIILPPGSVFTLTDPIGDAGLPLVSTEITIQGSGATIERDPGAASDFRVVYVGLFGNLTLDSVVVRGGQAVGNGGGILNNQGTLTVADSLITGNTASGYGGGIESYSTVTVINSTISNNSAGNRGGAIDTFGNFSDLTLLNATLAGNTAAGGGAGLHLEPQDGGGVNLTNVIIANSEESEDCLITSGSIGANVANLIEDGTCSPAFSGDPNLDGVADNGGLTPTMALLEGSTALDTGDNAACPAGDQRGASRSDGRCDIGAFEGPVDRGPIFVDMNAIGELDDGRCSLSEAINNANGDNVQFVGAGECELGLGPDEIVLPKDGVFTFEQPAYYGSATPAIFSEVTITGNGASLVRSSKDGTPPFRLLSSFGPSLAVSNVTLSNGLSFAGAGLGASTDLTLNAVTIENSYALFGGGMYNFGTTQINQSSIVGNTAANYGGGLLLLGDTSGISATIENSTISGNLSNDGAGLRGTASLSELVLGIVNSTVSDNGLLPPDRRRNLDLQRGANAAIGASYPLTSPSGPGPASFGGGVRLVEYGQEITANFLNVTVSGNTAALGSGLDLGSANVNMENTIVANGAGGGADCELGAGSLDTNSGNLVEDGTCSPDFSGDPNLAALAFNGGPTQTQAILYPSDAIDNGSNAECPTTDQRGISRDTQCDIGAYEFVNTAPLLLADAFMISDAVLPGDEVGTLETQDAENNIPPTGAYEILSGNVGGAFAVEDDGTLTVVNDAALTQNFTLIVQVTDAGGLASTAAVSIEVLVGDALFRDGFGNAEPDL